MAKQCPDCKRFMALECMIEDGKDPWDCYLWWCCTNENCLRFEGGHIPAPEYQWLWNCLGIPCDELIESPELLKEYADLWSRLPRKYKSEYRQCDPALIASCN